MDMDYSALYRDLERILRTRRAITAAIDGPCASGKTTLAQHLRERFGARVIPMDDFFLPRGLRTPERYALPGGNVHYERFLEEIVPFLGSQRAEEPLIYRPFDCHVMDWGPLRRISWAPLTVVEGSYSLHETLREHYDIRILMTIGKEEQERRIRQREGARGLEIFKERWIPMENQYFESASLESICDFVL